MKASEKWGVSVDAAVELALKELELTKDEVNIEVLEESTKGFLGINSKLAKVRVTPKNESADRTHKEKATFDDIDKILADLPENKVMEVPDEIREEYDKYEQEELEDARESEKNHRPSADSRKNRSRNKNRDRKQKRAPLDLDTSLLLETKDLEPVKDHPVEKFLREITAEMGVDLDFELKAGKDLIFVNVSGPDTGTIIGKRGQTLDAVQYLAGLVANKEEENYTRVIIDAENYRAKRENTLVNLANRLAGKVERTKKSVTLEPMNPYERKVIHSTLQDNPKVKTRSEGKDPYRRVIIENK
jgi:spoIIIJ-associated protein